MDNWASHAIHTSSLVVGMKLLALCPIIQGGADRLAFEEFGANNVYNHVQQDANFMNISMNATGVIGMDTRISYFTSGVVEPQLEPDEGPFSSEFLVSWQRVCIKHIHSIDSRPHESVLTLLLLRFSSQ